MIKVGGDYNDTGMDQIFKGNWRGVFFFNAGTPELAKAAFLAGKWTQYVEFLGLNGLTVDQAGATTQRQKELAFFVQDQWFISPSLTVTLGLRYERLDNPDDPVLDVKKVLVPGAKNVQPDVQIPDANNQWSPRLSLAWSPEKNAKSVVRLSLGRYWSRTPGILFSQLYSEQRPCGHDLPGDRFERPGAGPRGSGPGMGRGLQPELRPADREPAARHVRRGRSVCLTIESDFTTRTPTGFRSAPSERSSASRGASRGYGPGATTSSA